MKIASVHMGNVILEILNRKDISVKELSRRVKRGYSTMRTAVNKKHIPCETLIQISEALDYNLFQEYLGADDRVKELNRENGQLKRDMEKMAIENQVLRDVLGSRYK